MTLTHADWLRELEADCQRLLDAGIRPLALVRRLHDAGETNQRSGVVVGYPQFQVPVRGISYLEWEGGAFRICLDFKDPDAAEDLKAKLKVLGLKSFARMSTDKYLNAAPNGAMHSQLHIDLRPFNE